LSIGLRKSQVKRRKEGEEPTGEKPKLHPCQHHVGVDLEHDFINAGMKMAVFVLEKVHKVKGLGWHKRKNDSVKKTVVWERD